MPTLKRSSRFVLVLACSLALVGCRPSVPKPKPGRLSLEEQRINAMVSIHAHAEAKKLVLPKQLRIMSLDAAVRFLIEDTERDYFGTSRRHRAIAKLFAYDAPLFHSALVALAGNAILHALEVAITGGSEEQKEQEANDKLNEPEVAGSPFKDCNWKTLSYNVDATNPMTISASVEVHPSSFATLERALDPQNWDVCSKFWNPPEHTFLAKRVGTQVTPKPAKPSDAPYHHEMYEHFHTITCVPTLWSQSCHTADFENMLDITSTPGTGNTQTYKADYVFVAPPIHGTMDGVTVTITKDDGYFAAAPASTPARWVVAGKKYLQFKETIGNDWAQKAFGYGVKELAAEIADIACCDVKLVSKLKPPKLLGVESVP